MEHHSNLVPWQKVTKATESKLKYMYINENFELSDEEIESKITDKTKDLGARHWTCINCGCENDRDINASINIMFEGLKIYCQNN